MMSRALFNILHRVLTTEHLWVELEHDCTPDLLTWHQQSIDCKSTNPLTLCVHNLVESLHRQVQVIITTYRGYIWNGIFKSTYEWHVMVVWPYTFGHSVYYIQQCISKHLANITAPLKICSRWWMRQEPPNGTCCGFCDSFPLHVDSYMLHPIDTSRHAQSYTFLSVSLG